MEEMDSITFRRIWRKWYKPTLDDLYKGYDSTGICLTPDLAIEKMEELFKSALQSTAEDTSSQVKINADSTFRPVPNIRFDDVAFTREAHHYAVDLFYRTYSPRATGKGGSRRGAPPLSTAYLGSILAMRQQGLNDAQIARKFGVPVGRIHKQLAIAEKRYCEVVKRIRELGAAQWRRLGIRGLTPEPPARSRKRRAKSTIRSTGK